ncbi:MAG: 4Fe-4S binding protein [Candidatus Sumerlaeia bacterium]|nr:4Fe-4S binding protein [Candidatus Sumerlaeia bacterium]
MTQDSEKPNAAGAESGEPAAEPKPAPKRRQRGRVFINEERCKGCGLCITFCPTHVLERASRFNTRGYHPPVATHPENCTGCDICGHFCPDYAIYGVRLAEPGKPKESKDDDKD